jgi:hypothetical protein
MQMRVVEIAQRGQFCQRGALWDLGTWQKQSLLFQEVKTFKLSSHEFFHTNTPPPPPPQAPWPLRT